MKTVVLFLLMATLAPAALAYETNPRIPQTGPEEPSAAPGQYAEPAQPPQRRLPYPPPPSRNEGALFPKGGDGPLFPGHGGRTW